MNEKYVHRSATFANALVNALERHPGRVALADAQAQLTYAETYARISQLGQVFASVGLSEGDALAQLSPNCVDAALVQLAAWTFGLRYVPLHPLGSVEDHLFILGDSEVQALVVHPSKLETHGALLKADSLLTVFSHGPGTGTTDLHALRPSFAPMRLELSSDPDAVAAVLYTGGTTGRPKGVTLTSAQMVMNVLLTLSGWEWPTEIRFLCSTPITHATGCMLVPILDRGGTIYLEPGFDAPRFLDLVQRHRITASFLVPTMIYKLTETQRAQPRDLASLESVIYGAAPAAVARLQDALETFGPVFTQIYSQSEAPCCAVVLRRSEHTVEGGERLTSCGRPIAGIEVAILADDCTPVLDGDVGEICMRGPSIMRGYWNRERETAAAFRGGWLHTGDLAYRDAQGFLYIVDRKKEMIISGGFNVYPREVEDVMSTHPDVAQVAVIGVPDDYWGEAVKAIVVLNEGARAQAADLIAYVRERKGVVAAPKTVDFAQELPLTALGKPDKKVMRQRYWSGKARQVN
ncbi:MAG: AMP-binding protein [Pseudomonadota bacterium]